MYFVCICRTLSRGCISIHFDRRLTVLTLLSLYIFFSCFIFAFAMSTEKMPDLLFFSLCKMHYVAVDVVVVLLLIRVVYRPFWHVLLMLRLCCSHARNIIMYYTLFYIIYMQALLLSIFNHSWGFGAMASCRTAFPSTSIFSWSYMYGFVLLIRNPEYRKKNIYLRIKFLNIIYVKKDFVWTIIIERKIQSIPLYFLLKCKILHEFFLVQNDTLIKKLNCRSVQ